MYIIMLLYIISCVCEFVQYSTSRICRVFQMANGRMPSFPLPSCSPYFLPLTDYDYSVDIFFYFLSVYNLTAHQKPPTVQHITEKHGARNETPHIAHVVRQTDIVEYIKQNTRYAIPITRVIAFTASASTPMPRHSLTAAPPCFHSGKIASS